MSEIELRLQGLLARMSAGEQSAFLEFGELVKMYATFYLLGAGAGIDGHDAVDVADGWVFPITASAHIVAQPPYFEWLVGRIEGQLRSEFFNDAAKLQRRAYQSLQPLPDAVLASVGVRAKKRLSGDVVFVSKRDRYLLFALGDVASHGDPAAMSASILRQTLFLAHNEAPVDDPVRHLQHIALHIDRFLKDAELKQPQLPIVFALFDTADSSLAVLNCGSQALPIYIQEGIASHIPCGSIMLGTPFALSALEVWTAKLCPGDVLVLVTDGVIEQSRDFDRHRLRDHVESLDASEPGSLVEGIFSHLETLAVTEPQDDDQTVVAVMIARSSAAGS